MSIVPCYDYYQLTMQVNISEEDSCLYSRYGPSVFSIKKCDTKKDCASCDGVAKPQTGEYSVEAKIPDAVILNIDIDRCDCTKATFIMMVRLPCITRSNDCNRDGERRHRDEPDFETVKFCLTSGTSGYDRELMTFIVRPLSGSVTSTGVVEKCYSYEITRVSPLDFVHPEGPYGAPITDKALCANGLTIPIAPSAPCRCRPAHLAYVPNTLRITFPLTNELKCLLPDFGLPGTVLNAQLGTVATIVKIVSQCPQKYSFPAKMTFDKINCTVCVEISEELINEYYNKCGTATPYSHAFGRFGCKAVNNVNPHCSNEEPFYELFKAHGLFNLLALSRKLEIVGVHKCTETTFFSFQVCVVPYRQFCYDICGCRVTIVPTITEDGMSFSVKSEKPYTYEFSCQGGDCYPTTTEST